ncbi:hypothetical protein NDU88_003568 [Pleurodeles waltl]|uniref:Protein-serine/threonine phosphatase n=1 Tax=Pleurodeles waltl TaxID=8319 RepID=A0AAV7QDF6_PLEWA|nr:hypothetical protein NDU88_003568 [Pleurodeles waltl]
MIESKGSEVANTRDGQQLLYLGDGSGRNYMSKYGEASMRNRQEIEYQKRMAVSVRNTLALQHISVHLSLETLVRVFSAGHLFTWVTAAPSQPWIYSFHRFLGTHHSRSSWSC